MGSTTDILPEDPCDPIIDSALAQCLLTELIPVEPHASVRGRILQNVRKAIRETQPSQFLTCRNEDGQWKKVGEGVFQKHLIANDRLAASLYRMMPGSSFPGHLHPTDEECMCIEGEVDIGGFFLKAGEFHFAPQGQPHGPTYSETGCLLYIRCGASPTEMA